MKRSIICAMTFLTCGIAMSTISSTRCAAATTKSATKSVAKATQSATFLVEGMSCIGCSNGLLQGLQSLKGVSGANVDLATKRAVVKFDPQLQNVNKLRAFIVQSGFKATLAPATKPAAKTSSPIQKGKA